MKTEARNIKKAKILSGLEHAYKKMIEFKKEKNSEIVIIKDHKIVYVKPESIVLNELEEENK
ncbi:hypothetical protein HX004_05770 [Myroides sp. 1354]|uniref:hypothetical protein n=1 Tax=unclassified Myroides TaxID=2642485 RepID=UPI002575E2B7|nr:MULTISPECIES: hypothetical protein [unclassified Myroides]MDM1044570.1 hypothetical protein [Myroides sp. R163-1]MDM1055283.1 hypothetical protein [Myroides sp. 1354]MDM1068580.1 hypothetical protein [Myroides sp. 1372]